MAGFGAWALCWTNPGVDTGAGAAALAAEAVAGAGAAAGVALPDFPDADTFAGAGTALALGRTVRVPDVPDNSWWNCAMTGSSFHSIFLMSSPKRFHSSRPAAVATAVAKAGTDATGWASIGWPFFFNARSLRACWMATATRLSCTSWLHPIVCYSVRFAVLLSSCRKQQGRQSTTVLRQVERLRRECELKVRWGGRGRRGTQWAGDQVMGAGYISSGAHV